MIKYDCLNAENYIRTNVMVTNIVEYMKNNKITFKKMSSDMNIPESTLKSAVAVNYSAISTLEKICVFYNIMPNFDKFNYGAACGKEQAIVDLTNYLNTTLYHLSKQHTSEEEFKNYYILIAYEFLFNNRIYIPSSIRRKSKFIDLNKKLTEANNNIIKILESILKEKGLKFNPETYQSIACASLNKYEASYDISSFQFDMQSYPVNNDANYIGTALNNIKKESGLSLSKFGNIFDLHKSTIKNIEAGRGILKYDYVKWIYALFNNVDINSLITNEQATLNLNYEKAYDEVAKSVPALASFRTRDADNKLRTAIQFLTPEPSFIPEYERLEAFLGITSTGFKINSDYLFESFNFPDVKLKPKDIEWLNEAIAKAIQQEYKDALTRKYTKICFKEFYHYKDGKITLTDDKLYKTIEQLQKTRRP